MSVPTRYIQPGTDAIPVAATTAYDCLTQHGRPCTVVAEEAGDFVCTTPGSGATTRTIAMVAGQASLFQVETIDSSSAIAVHVVVWG